MSLSEKIEYVADYNIFSENTIHPAVVQEVLTFQNVREAVKELKESIEQGVKRNNVLPLDWCFDRIDKIFGEKLT